MDPARLLGLRDPHLHPPYAELLRPGAALGRGDPRGDSGMSGASLREGLTGVVAESPAMRELLPVILRLAQAKSPVLLDGESGTGKDLRRHWPHHPGAPRPARATS